MSGHLAAISLYQTDKPAQDNIRKCTKSELRFIDMPTDAPSRRRTISDANRAQARLCARKIHSIESSLREFSHYDLDRLCMYN
jgi:hypothetical protein